MKTWTIGIAALAGLLLTAAAPSPANAHPGDRDYRLRLTPAYAHRADRCYRVDRRLRQSWRHRYHYPGGKRRYLRDRNLWHRCFDIPRYRYSGRKHRWFHEPYGHVHHKRRGHRQRHW